MLVGATVSAYVCTEATDMRKAIDGLIQEVLAHFPVPPQSGALFVFLNRARNKVKVLYWDRTGFALWYKRLERGRFPDPARLPSSALAFADLALWLEGIELATTRRLRALEVRACA
jgi:transposase